MEVSGIFFELVQSALWGLPLHNVEKVASLYPLLSKLADKQAVTALVGRVVMDSQYGIKLPQVDAVRLYAKVNQVAAINKKANSCVAELCNLLSSHQIPFIIVKGQTIGSLYSIPEARSAGDIDFYCDDKHFGRARKLISEEWNVEFEEEDEEDGEQHISFRHGGMLFEMHYNLMKLYSKKNQQYWDSLLVAEMNKGYTVVVDGCKVPTLSPEANVLYTFLHLYNHFLELGVGIRQFCDVAVLLKAHKGNLNVALLQTHLESLGYLKAFKAVGTILVDKLGLAEEDFPFPLSAADRKYQKMILDVVFTGGNFGFYGRKTSVRQGMAYYCEAAWNKVRSFYRYYDLAPEETRARFFYEFPKKIKFGITHLLRQKQH